MSKAPEDLEKGLLAAIAAGKGSYSHRLSSEAFESWSGGAGLQPLQAWFAAIAGLKGLHCAGLQDLSGPSGISLFFSWEG